MSRTYLTPPTSACMAQFHQLAQYCEKDVCTLLVTVTAELTNQYNLLCSTIRPETFNPEDIGVWTTSNPSRATPAYHQPATSHVRWTIARFDRQSVTVWGSTSKLVHRRRTREKESSQNASRYTFCFVKFTAILTSGHRLTVEQNNW